MAAALGISLVGIGLERPAWAADQALAGLTDEQKTRVQGIQNRLNRIQPKIVGGERARPDDFPWAASLAFIQTGGALFSYCGGSLIAPQWVVTAAHCDVRVGEKVILGRLDLTTNEGKVFNVTQVINHEDYNSDTSDSDIALVKLSQASSQQPIPLITQDSNLAATGNDFTVAGWGLLEEAGDASDVLMKVEVPILSNEVCQINYSGTGVVITDNMLCAGKTGKDSCQGDSGGPGMVVDTIQDTERLAGVVSFGIGCARPGFPGVYTRVAKFVPWITENTGVAPLSEGCPVCN